MPKYRITWIEESTYEAIVEGADEEEAFQILFDNGYEPNTLIHMGVFSDGSETIELLED
jgi:hypothetical protein